MRKLISLVILLPLALVILVVSVANRHVVTLALNPFDPADPVLALSLPFFVFLFLAVMVGVVIGSVVTWFRQGHYRKAARNEAHAARRWREEADKQKTRIEQLTTQSLISAGRERGREG